MGKKALSERKIKSGNIQERCESCAFFDGTLEDDALFACRKWIMS